MGSLISTPPVLIRSGPWSSVSGLPADKISEIDQPAGLVWLFLSIEKKESAVCASHLLLGSAGRHGILLSIVPSTGDRIATRERNDYRTFAPWFAS